MSLPVPPAVTALQAAMAPLRDAIDDLADALAGANDPVWLDTFQPAIALAHEVIAVHAKQPNRAVADDLVALRSTFQRHDIPRSDPEMGPSKLLSSLRGARGTILEELRLTLELAVSAGFHPSITEMQLPSVQVAERAGFEFMLASLAHRVRKVEAGLDAISAEADPEKNPSMQQVGLINFYVPNMKMEAALARLEVTGKAFIDFEVLGRAVARMGELTSDFLSSVNGMRRTITNVLRETARSFRPLVSRVNRGFITLIKSTLKRSHAITVASPISFSPNPSYNNNEKSQNWQYLMEQYEDTVALDPTNVWAWIELGRLKINYGTLAEARNCFDSAWNHATVKRDLSVLHDEFGEILVAEGQMAAAESEFEAGLTIAEALAMAEPSSASLQRDISVSLGKVGDVLRAQGRLADALERFERGLAIREALAKAEPSSASLQRDISVSLDQVGDVLRAQGRLADALEAFERGLAIAEALAKADPSLANLQRDIEVSLTKVGDVLVEQGRLADALERFERGLAIAEALAKADPSSVSCQRDISVNLTKVGNVLMTQGRLADALERFERDLAITQALTEADPGNVKWQHDVIVSHAKIAQVEEGLGSIPAAIANWRKAEAIAAALVARLPGEQAFATLLDAVRSEIARVEGL